ncbi:MULTISPECIES: hypothetical protein [unclassified Microcoleus]|uniref:hypothetical protein n=1 Tax=unclassified Microcoleus TaxID=2642155 RepID=UPI0025F4AAAB|nr:MULTISPECIES: hypothetical protein [unclassified Microcoleus]
MVKCVGRGRGVAIALFEGDSLPFTEPLREDSFASRSFLNRFTTGFWARATMDADG